MKALGHLLDEQIAREQRTLHLDCVLQIETRAASVSLRMTPSTGQRFDLTRQARQQ